MFKWLKRQPPAPPPESSPEPAPPPDDAILRVFNQTEDECRVLGDYRVLIVRRANGNFGYELEQWQSQYWTGDHFWFPQMQLPFGIYGSEEIAIREAAACIPWLRERLESAE